MSEDKIKKSDSFSHKDLLYSEILNTSARGHIRDLFVKKQKSCTHPVQRSTVLARASEFLKSVDKVDESVDKLDENVQNIEDVEEGQPFIDMDVRLIQRADDSECDSELDLNEEDSDDETEDDESITSSESDEEPEDIKVDCGLHDTLVHKRFVANGELSQNGSTDILLKNGCMLKNLKSKCPESKKQEGILLNQKLSSSTDSDCEQSDSGENTENLIISSDLSNEQFKSDSKRVSKLAVSSVQSNQLSDQQSEAQDRNFLELSKPDFGLLNDNISDSSCKHESSIQSLDDLRSRKRKLIAVIEDEDSSNLCLTKTQKIV